MKKAKNYRYWLSLVVTPNKNQRTTYRLCADFLNFRLMFSYFTSSKTTLTDYQCVSTGCCTHVAKTEITIDNQHVTKSLQRYRFLPKQPKENTEKNTNLSHFLDFGLPYSSLPILYFCQCCHFFYPARLDCPRTFLRIFIASIMNGDCH